LAANDPTLLSDVFFRIGGAELGRATTSLSLNTPQIVVIVGSSSSFGMPLARIKVAHAA